MKNLITIINLAIIVGVTSIFSKYDDVQEKKEKDKPVTAVKEALVAESESIGTVQSNFAIWPVQWTGDDNEDRGVEKEEVGETIINFVIEMTETTMRDLERGKIAAQKATKRPLKDFGALMVKDQSSMLDELKLLAVQKNISIPADLDHDKAEDVNELTEVHGVSFDKKFVAMKIKDLKKDLKKIERATRSTDADIQVFATKYLPVVQSHLDRIKALKRTH
jgi:putative membrane protein